MCAGLPGVSELIDLSAAVSLSLVISLDGQLVGPDQSSRSISGPEDLDWLRRLRASSDIIVVGAATAEAEGYRPIRVRQEFAAAREAAYMPEHPETLVVRRSDDISSVLRPGTSRVLLEAGVRLHTALAASVDRVWLSHSPTMVGDVDAAFAFPLESFHLVSRHLGAEFVVSRFERINPR